MISKEINSGAFRKINRAIFSKIRTGMNHLHKSKLHYTLAASLLLMMHCSGMISEITYDPPVVFTGYICGDYKTLRGNGAWKNQCRLVKDTLRMYFYSDDFQEINNIRDGDLIRLDLYPGDQPLIGTSRVLFHMARYHGKNSSYYVRPKDTLTNSAVIKMQMQISGEKSSDKILFNDLYIRSSPESGTNGEILEIKDGKIEGVIE